MLKYILVVFTHYQNIANYLSAYGQIGQLKKVHAVNEGANERKPTRNYQNMEESHVKRSLHAMVMIAGRAKLKIKLVVSISELNFWLLNVQE